MARRRITATCRTPCAYPNQWRALRKLRGLSQERVARFLGHLNVNYYQDIEAGRHFPGPRILTVLLALFEISLHQAYPTLMWEAEATVKRLGRLRRERGATSRP